MNMKRLSMILLAVLPCCTGCYTLADRVDECSMKMRAKWLAEKAWWSLESYYDTVPHEPHFAKGFKKGYADVVFGRSGRQPALPPRSYWSPRYQTPEGRHKIHTWFDGYSHGALAAEQDGVAGLGRIPLSPTARHQLRAHAEQGHQPTATMNDEAVPTTEAPELSGEPQPGASSSAGTADGRVPGQRLAPSGPLRIPPTSIEAASSPETTLPAR